LWYEKLSGSHSTGGATFCTADDSKVGGCVEKIAPTMLKSQISQDVLMMCVTEQRGLFFGATLQFG